MLQRQQINLRPCGKKTEIKLKIIGTLRQFSVFYVQFRTLLLHMFFDFHRTTAKTARPIYIVTRCVRKQVTRRKLQFITNNLKLCYEIFCSYSQSLYVCSERLF